jgi:hypothetical protein
MKQPRGIGITRKAASLAVVLFVFAEAGALATGNPQAQPAATQAIENTGPTGTLVHVLEAACQQNVQDFSHYLLSDSAQSLAGLPGDEQKTFLERFSLSTVAGHARALLDTSNRTVVRCDTAAEAINYHLNPPRIDGNVAFVTVIVENGEKVDFGLVQQRDGWRLFSLGLLVIDVPALIQQWEQAELEANEQIAIGNLFALEQAIKTYQDAFGQLPDKLDQLGPAPPNDVSPEHAQLVSAQLASADTDGYRFRYHIVTGPHNTNEGFELAAVPEEYGKTGRRSFLLDTQGKLHAADKQGAPATPQDPVITAQENQNPA